MADTESIDLLEKENISKELKTLLNEWKEVIVLLNAIMTWEKNWFPAITITCVTSLYLYVWLVNCSILNLIWTGCLCATLLDCIVNGPFRKTFPPNSWDQDKDRIYADVVEYTADCYVTYKLYVTRFLRLRQTNIRLFHSILLMSFFSLLYIGINFNNLFISYISVLVILLFPGFKMRSEYIEDSFQKCFHLMISYLWSSENKIASS